MSNLQKTGSLVTDSSTRGSATSTTTSLIVAIYSSPALRIREQPRWQGPNYQLECCPASTDRRSATNSRRNWTP
jgi:hypothetical protein